MANPLRVLANMPKNPYDYVGRATGWMDAEDQVAALKAQGYDAKYTTQYDKYKRTTGYNVWKREKSMKK